MAKSSSFFGMRKKSTKSLTFSTWRGIQITKDRVTDVSNPQTSAQMLQRLKMPLVAQARTTLKGLVNHSFQGVEYGYKSLYRFSSLNLRSNNLAITAYVPKGSQMFGMANFVVSQGSLPAVSVGVTTASVTKNAFTLSDGSTYSPTNFVDAASAPIFKVVNPNAKMEIAGDAPTSAEWLAFWKTMLLEDVETDQLSILALVAHSIREYDTGEANAAGTDTIKLLQPVYQPYLYRIGYDTVDAAANKISFAQSTADGATCAHLVFGNHIDVAVPIVVDGKSYSLGVDNWQNAVDNDSAYEGIKLTTYFPSASNSDRGGIDTAEAAIFALPDNGENPLIGGVSIIRSRKSDNTWLRSPQRLIPCSFAYFDYASVIDTYLKSQSGSAKFLNNGDEDTNITGNSGFEITTSSFDDDKSQG